MFEELLKASARYSARFSLHGLSPEPRSGIGLVTCMDTRVEPMAILDFRPGDAKILRNAGGRVTTDVLRSLMLATSFLGVRWIVVMHHTRRALANTTDNAVMTSLDPHQRRHVRGGAILAMPDPDAALASDVEVITSCRSLASGIEVEGWRYDVDTGTVERVITFGGKRGYAS